MPVTRMCPLAVLCFAAALPLFSQSAPPAQADPTNPVADPHAVVQLGDVRFTVLTPQLIRMEWAADGKFIDDPSFIMLNRRLPVPAFKQKTSSSKVTIDTADLHLTYSGGPKSSGFTASNLAVTLQVDGKPVTWHPGMASSGQSAGHHPHAWTTRVAVRICASPWGRAWFRATAGPWSMTTGRCLTPTNFDMSHGDPTTQPWIKQRPAGQRTDEYFFGYGHDYKQALSDYVRVAGRIPLPPRYAFGAWWSRYWAYSDQELRELVNGFHQNSVPLDVFVIDMDWHNTFGRHFDVQDASGHGKGWSGYSWDKTLFPDPKDFLTELHDQGLKVTLNLHPASGVQPWEDAYPQFARNMGIDPATKQYVPFDLTDRKFAKNYVDLLHHPLEKEGIDFWWLDWQQEMHTKVAGVNPTWWLNYIHFTDQEHEGKRPLLFHRWGGLGNHRYQIGFSGDTFSVWDSLAFQPWFTATAANVGYAYWSHDIGGHQPGKVDPELYTRWIQFGIFSPILRTHTTKNAEAERRIWAYPEPYSDTMREAFQLRYAMQPYLYTEARRTYDTGIAFDRPLYYDFPEAPEAYTTRNEYMFGDNMIVAPVVKPADTATGLATEHIWLPKGEWIESSTGTHLQGPVSVDRSYSINQLPVFVRAGTIVPMQPPMLYTGQKPVDPLILTVYPLAEGQSSSYTVYEDSGHAEDYKSDIGTARTEVTAKQSGDELTVTVAPVRGGFDGMPAQHRIELRLPADWPPDSVTANGTPLSFTLDANHPGWRFEGNTLTTIVPTTMNDVHAATTITVRRAAGSLQRRDALNGFAGRMTRLRQAYDQFSGDFPTTAAVPDPLTISMQTGDRIGYHPDSARAEIEALPAHYAEAVAATQAMHDDSKPSTKPVSGAPATGPEAERSQAHQGRVNHALADLQDGNNPQATTRP